MSSPAITPEVIAYVHDIIDDILTGIIQNEPPAKKESLASGSPGNNNLDDSRNQPCEGEGEALHDILHNKSAAIKSQVCVHNTKLGQEQNSETGNSKLREEGLAVDEESSQDISFLPTTSVGEEQGTVSYEHSGTIEEKDDLTDEESEESEDLSLEGIRNVDLHKESVEPGVTSDITRSNTRKETSEDSHKTVQSSQKRFNIDLEEENRLLTIIIMSTIS